MARELGIELGIGRRKNVWKETFLPWRSWKFSKGLHRVEPESLELGLGLGL